ncbi:hypothetical protein PFISCL1PPCAC_26943, partial [Pristionchus fissidentatus]
FQIGKVFAEIGYLLYFVTTIPMCIASVWKLYHNRTRKVRLRIETRLGLQTSTRNEQVVALYAVVLTVTHALKATQQTIWFVALFTNAEPLQASTIKLYTIPNALTSFAEPILLIFTSQTLRNEV